MLSDLRKSISSILHERVTSPLYGTFIISWLIWNWKIVYLTIFISKNSITGTKIDYIVNNYSQISNLLVYPLISTLILITLVPFVSNKAYSLSMYFRDKRIKKKNSYDEKQLLTIKQSTALRLETRNLEVELQGVIEKKDFEIEQLENQLKEAQIKPIITSTKDAEKYDLDNISKEYLEIKKNNRIFSSLGHLIRKINEFGNFPNGTDKDIIEYYLVNNIVDKDPSGGYFLNNKGLQFYKKYVNETFVDTTVED